MSFVVLYLQILLKNSSIRACPVPEPPNGLLNCITVTPSVTSTVAGSLVTYTVNLFSGADLFTSTQTVTLSLDDFSTIGGDSSKTTSSGIATFLSSIKTIGLRTIIATVESITGSATVTVKAILNIQIQGSPQDTTDIFDISVSIVDSDYVQIPNKAKVTFTITIDCGNCIIPAFDSKYSIVYKQVILYDYKISTTGLHVLTASGTDLVTGVYNMNSLVSGVKTVTLANVPQEISINTLFTVKLSISSFDDQPITLTSLVQFTDEFENSLGSTNYNANAAYQHYNILIPSLLISSITATCKGVKTVVPIKILPLKFIMSLSVTPTKAGDIFDINFSILNSLGNSESSGIESYYASIMLSKSSGGNSGLSVNNFDTNSINALGVILTNRIVAGPSNLNGAFIASSGSFLLTITSNYAQKITPATLSLVIAPKVGSVALSGPTSLIVYKKFSITVSIYGVDGNPMKDSLTIALSDGGSFTGNSPITTTTSLATFTVYATQIISITYSASVVFNLVTTPSTPTSITASVIKASLKAVFSPANFFM